MLYRYPFRLCVLVAYDQQIGYARFREYSVNYGQLSSEPWPFCGHCIIKIFETLHEYPLYSPSPIRTSYDDLNNNNNNNKKHL